jgi:hypothetical protein
MASTGLALGLSSPVFAQARPPVLPDTITGPMFGSAAPAAPAAVAPVPPLAAAASPMTPGEGETVQPSRFYGGAECLLWWFKENPVRVPLLTTTSDPDAMPVAAIDDPNTRVLLGNHDLSTGVHAGARFTAGYWLDERQQIAVEGSYFFLNKQTTVRTLASTGDPNSPILAVPFADQDAGIENSFVIASPGSFAGSATLSLNSRLQGAEVQCAVQAFDGNRLHIQVLAGFRYLDLTESLSYATASTGLSDPNTDLILTTVDQFDMRNQFYGFQVGTRADYRLGNLEISASAKLALGDMSQTANFNGRAATNFFTGPAGGPFTGVPPEHLRGGGIFVQPSNRGSASRDQIAFAPEFGVNVAYQLTPHLRVFAGYDFLYLSNVIRPGEQIDRGINVSQTVQKVLTGIATTPGSRPAVTLTGSDFWAQGINMGLEFRY